MQAQGVVSHVLHQVGRCGEYLSARSAMKAPTERTHAAVCTICFS